MDAIILMTTLPIETVEDVLRVVDYYVARWTIEVWFRTLKTGCLVEKLQLETRAAPAELSGVLRHHRLAGAVFDAAKSRLPPSTLHRVLCAS